MGTYPIPTCGQLYNSCLAGESRALPLFERSLGPLGYGVWHLQKSPLGKMHVKCHAEHAQGLMLMSCECQMATKWGTDGNARPSTSTDCSLGVGATHDVGITQKALGPTSEPPSTAAAGPWASATRCSTARWLNSQPSQHFWQQCPWRVQRCVWQMRVPFNAGTRKSTSNNSRDNSSSN